MEYPLWYGCSVVVTYVVCISIISYVRVRQTYPIYYLEFGEHVRQNLENMYILCLCCHCCICRIHAT